MITSNWKWSISQMSQMSGRIWNGLFVLLLPNKSDYISGWTGNSRGSSKKEYLKIALLKPMKVCHSQFLFVGQKSPAEYPDMRQCMLPTIDQILSTNTQVHVKKNLRNSMICSLFHGHVTGKKNILTTTKKNTSPLAKDLRLTSAGLSWRLSSWSFRSS